MGRSNANPAKTTEAPMSRASQVARIMKTAPYEEPSKKNARERALAGTYRVIHGTVLVPRPDVERREPDGSLNPHVGPFVHARLGDEVWLGDEDAARMLDADLVERLDTKPSRVGKVWAPPKPSTRMPG